MGGDERNHHEKLGLGRISCASQFTMPDTAGTTPNPAGNNTNMRSSTPNQGSHTPDFLCPLVSCISFPSLSPIPLSLSSSQNTKLSQPSLSLHAMMISWHWVQHTPSTAYTEYSIHRVQHTPRTASTQDCLYSFHSHIYQLTSECTFSFRHASLQDRPPLASSLWELTGMITSSHSHGCELTN